MKTIHKFQIEITDSQIVEMPMKAKILSVQVQRHVPCLWALVDTDYDLENRHIHVYGTGNPMDELAEYVFIGTIQTQESRFVWHVFEQL